MFDVRAQVMQEQGWTLTVRDLCSGEVVRRVKGSASPTSPIRAIWDGSR